MAGETKDASGIENTPAVATPVVGWLRLEGLAVVALSAILYAHLHAQGAAKWWLFGRLWLTPDLSFLGYQGGPRFGYWCYNSVHSYLLPLALVMGSLLGGVPALLPFALIWFNHIGLDRSLGYGLKYPQAFGLTHLKRLGKA